MTAYLVTDDITIDMDVYEDKEKAILVATEACKECFETQLVWQLIGKAEIKKPTYTEVSADD